MPTSSRPSRAVALSWLALAALAVASPRPAPAQQLAAVQRLGDPVDVSDAFREPDDAYFFASRLTTFDPATGAGRLQWDRYALRTNVSFQKADRYWARSQDIEFPSTEYDRDPALPFEISFVTPRTIRLRFSTRDVPWSEVEHPDSLMLAGPVPVDRSWRVDAGDSVVTYTSAFGRVRVAKNPWSVEILDAAGHALTRTQRQGEPASLRTYVPFSFVRRASDLQRFTAGTFELAPDEKIFGMGESFTRLDKRGQHVVEYQRDAMGVQNQWQYKSIPFFLSDRGYGMFVHTSAPVTFDVGRDFDAHNTIYTGDEVLDVFVFIGDPKQVLSEYTALTGRSPVPPLWSFGLWMSRITYNSEAQVREVAAKLRQYRIPADVLHLDTGWFETDWRSDYRFSPTRFTDPAKMIRDLRQQGFRVSLWQYTYFTPKNPLWKEMVDSGYEVRDQGGRLPPEDAVLDFTNPAAVRWYEAKLTPLLEMGVGAIKVDFGEGAPLTGVYHSGRTGWYEHNIYPVRYNRDVFELTKQLTGDGIIWARSAWAGSQRYPLHWGGDAENTNSAMAAELRGGLSFGLSGFTYWSHDIGGFLQRSPRDLYGRWLAFGMLTSHSRTHGAGPREPWTYDSAFVDEFRRAVDLKYTLMPYVYAQAKESSAHGWSMLRTLFFEYPDDPTSWTVEDEYLFGSDLLVAPMFDDGADRRVYLPPGAWIDYQTGRTYVGARWHRIAHGQIPVVLLVRDHAVIPQLALAQSTEQMDWKHVELRTFSTDGARATGRFALPNGGLDTLEVVGGRLAGDPLGGRVTWRVTRAPATPAVP